MTTTRRKKATKKIPVTNQLAAAAGKKKAANKKDETLVNHVGIIVDRSWSMDGWVEQVVRTVNEQFANLRVASDEEGQETYVTLRTFSTNVDEPIISAQPVNTLRDWSEADYYPYGYTALFDAIGYTVRDLERVKNATSKNTSFLLIIITDGEENDSREFSNKIKQEIARVQKTDRWSFVCLVPPRHRQYTADVLGIPLGNVREWEQSEAGFENVRSSVSAGLSNYYTARSAGATRTTAFFVDADHIQETDLDNLDDVSGDFFMWTVDSVPDGEKVRIDGFVNDRISRNQRVRRTGDRFQIGRGYYQLTKPEKVQPSKDMVIQHLDTGKMYGGQQARALLGIPMGQYVRVRPGQLDGYRIFVKSTSVNRNLIGGTKFLYSKS